MAEPAPPTPLALPHPFRSALAFVSDIDGTSFPSFRRVMGCFYGVEPEYDGVELEVASSLWLMAKPDQRKLRNAVYALELDGTERDFVRGRIAPLLRSPLFDSIHTYGTFKQVFERRHAELCVDYAEQHGIRTPFWTFHGSGAERHNAVVGGDDWVGDDPSSDAYHLDLVPRLGVRFHRTPPGLDLVTGQAKRAVVTALDGSAVMTQTCHSVLNEPTDPAAIRDWIDHLGAEDLLRVDLKRIHKGNDRWPNRTMTWHPELLWAQLLPEVLDTAVEQRRVLYVNQHLTRAKSAYAYGALRTVDAVRRLDELQRRGDMLVSSPARLITFEVLRDHAEHRVTPTEHGWRIDLAETVSVDGWSMTVDRDDLDGIGFTHDGRLELWFRGERLDTETVSAGGQSVTSVPWRSRLGAMREALAEWHATFGDDDG